MLNEDQNIFSSFLSLSFSNLQIQSLYNQRNHPKISTFNKIAFCCLGLLSITTTILIIIKHPPKPSKNAPSKWEAFFVVIVTSSSVLTAANIVLSFFSFCKNISIKIQIIFSCIAYCFITLEFTLLKLIIELAFAIKWEKYFFINIIDYLVRIIVHFLGLIDFIESIIINLILTVLILILYYADDSINSIIYDSGATFIILNLGLILCTYFITKNDKNIFYYYTQINELNARQNAILDNLNTGYLRLHKNKIEFMNAALIETIKNAKHLHTNNNNNGSDCNNTRLDLNINNNNNNKWLCNNKETVYDVLLNKMNIPKKDVSIQHSTDDRINVVDTLTITNNEQMLNIPLENIRSYYKEIFHTKEEQQQCVSTTRRRNNAIHVQPQMDFYFLDYQTLLLTDGINLTYEVLFKCEGDDIEFIFNDITRTKEFEHREYNIKIKNVFLTKIAHEFKNPLISLSELILQIKEILLLNEQITKNCDLGRTLCEYLLILIKDLDFFSIDNRTNLYTSVTKERIHIPTLTSFCLSLGKQKLQLLNKDKDVEFNTTIEKECPEYLYSDDIKLKQILLNLITNATKFTSKGHIELVISKQDDDNIKFIVKDTGKGIPFHKRKSLLDYKDKNNTSVEGGIGLTIIKELSALLGKEIEYISEENKGSFFWFSLPINGTSYSLSPHKFTCATTKLCCEGNNLNHNNISLLNSSTSTVKVDTFHLEFNNQSVMNNNKESQTFNIIVTDDEVLARKALIRVLNEVANKLEIKLTIYEAEDGVELLYLIYQYSTNTNNIHIDAIISDQTMNYINGAAVQNILNNYINMKKYIPFFIVTAYDVNAAYFNNINLDGVFSKPLRKYDAEIILKQLIEL